MLNEFRLGADVVDPIKAHGADGRDERHSGIWRSPGHDRAIEHDFRLACLHGGQQAKITGYWFLPLRIGFRIRADHEIDRATAFEKQLWFACGIGQRIWIACAPCRVETISDHADGSAGALIELRPRGVLRPILQLSIDLRSGVADGHGKREAPLLSGGARDGRRQAGEALCIEIDRGKLAPFYALQTIHAEDCAKLFPCVENHFAFLGLGQAWAKVLVVKGDSLNYHPTLCLRILDADMRRDPDVAADVLNEQTVSGH